MDIQTDRRQASHRSLSVVIITSYLCAALPRSRSQTDLSSHVWARWSYGEGSVLAIDFMGLRWFPLLLGRVTSLSEPHFSSSVKWGCEEPARRLGGGDGSLYVGHLARWPAHEKHPVSGAATVLPLGVRHFGSTELLLFKVRPSVRPPTGSLPTPSQGGLSCSLAALITAHPALPPTTLGALSCGGLTYLTPPPADCLACCRVHKCSVNVC